MTQPQPHQQPLKRKAGRPPQVQKLLPSYAAADETPTDQETSMTTKVGHFITVNTPQRKGIRVDISDISEYAKAGQELSDIQIVFKNGRSSIYRFGSEKDAYAFLEVLDGYCL